MAHSAWTGGSVYTGQAALPHKNIQVIECDGVKVMYVGIENQTDIDADETIRVIGYDGTSYRGQLLGENEKKYPVVTLVLYFGERKWNRNKTLYETLDI